MQISFWDKNKVFIYGLAGAIIMGLIPILQPGTSTTVTIVMIVMAAITATAAYLSKNLRGKAQSITGIIFSVIVIVVPVLFAHGKLDWQNLFFIILSQVGAQFFGYSSAPFKPSSYEHNETIVEAKKVPPKDQVENVPPMTAIKSIDINDV